MIGPKGTDEKVVFTLHCVMLVMEIGLAMAVTLLLLLMSSVLGTLVHSVTRSDVLAKISETIAFVWCLRSVGNRYFAQRQWRFRRSTATFSLLWFLLHGVAVTTLAVWQDETRPVVSWTNVYKAVRRSDGSFALLEILENVVLAPIKEELVFRGVLVPMAETRLQSVRWSALVSSMLFALVHVANARHLDATSAVGFQVLWAWLVGCVLAVRLAVSRSLIECVVLHSVNNLFALGVTKTRASEPFVLVPAIVIYSVVIYMQLAALKRKKRIGPCND